MRRQLSAALLAAALAALCTPATTAYAGTAAAGQRWAPAPTTPWSRPAGVLCDFGIHVEPVVDEVRVRVLATYPDGSPRREVYVGPLVLRVTNDVTGAWTDVDAGGSSVITYRPGGSFDVNSFWQSVGPAVFGFREGRGNRPRGLYRFDGVYTVDFDETGYKTVTVRAGTETEVCALLS